MATYEELVIKKIVTSIERDSKILDIGCGLGNKMRFLHSIGFNDITGIERNEQVVKIAKSNGLNVHVPEDFMKEENYGRYDLLFFSHIIEHFQYQDLKNFLEGYFPFLKPGGHIVIITPVLQADFFDDFDHVKPYGLRGLMQVFGDATAQVQFYSRHHLVLVDVRYVKLAYALKYFRALTLRNALYPLPRLINRILHLIYRLSFRTVGRTMAWVGLFKLENTSPREHLIP